MNNKLGEQIIVADRILGENDLRYYSDIIFETGDIVELRLLGKDNPIKLWRLAKDLPGMFEELLRYNRQGYNIYAGVNPRRADGKSGDKNVLFARCLFADFDDILPIDGCGPSEFVLMRIEEADLPNPTLVIYSGHGVHTYWRLKKPIEDLDKWKQLQERLITAIGSDKSIKNPERIMRIPGFLNVKKKPYTECFIIYTDVNND
jgi:integrase